MKFLKFYIILSVVAVMMLGSLCCDGNTIRMANIDYVQSGTGQKIKYSFKYANMTMKYHVLNETDIDETVFKFIWNYSNDEEKLKGHEILLAAQNDFEELREDWGFVLVFFGKNITQLKFYKKTEFGSAYTIEFMQKGVPVQMQFQIKAGEPNAEEFHNIIQKIIDQRQQKDYLNFLQE
jgi:hypothetical protein